MKITITLTEQDAAAVAEYSKRIGRKPEDWSREAMVGRARYWLEKWRLDEAQERTKYVSPAKR